MLRLLRTPFGLWIVWAVLLILFAVVRPKPSTPAFWVLAVAVFAVGVFFWLGQRADDLRVQNAHGDWRKRLTATGAIIDVEDDGHLYEWLNPSDWQVVFAALEELPPGSRSLRQVLLNKFPGTLP